MLARVMLELPIYNKGTDFYTLDRNNIKFIARIVKSVCQLALYADIISKIYRVFTIIIKKILP
jgi:hypothetical protein